MKTIVYYYIKSFKWSRYCQTQKNLKALFKEYHTSSFTSYMQYIRKMDVNKIISDDFDSKLFVNCIQNGNDIDFYLLFIFLVRIFGKISSESGLHTYEKSLFLDSLVNNHNFQERIASQSVRNNIEKNNFDILCNRDMLLIFQNRCNYCLSPQAFEVLQGYKNYLSCSNFQNDKKYNTNSIHKFKRTIIEQCKSTISSLYNCNPNITVNYLQRSQDLNGFFGDIIITEHMYNGINIYNIEISIVNSSEDNDENIDKEIDTHNITNSTNNEVIAIS